MTRDRSCARCDRDRVGELRRPAFEQLQHLSVEHPPAVRFDHRVRRLLPRPVRERALAVDTSDDDLRLERGRQGSDRVGLAGE
jgi:hypothetical protein